MKRKRRWKKVPREWISPFLPLAEFFCPEIIQKPGDLWSFKEVLFRTAIQKEREEIVRIRFAFHYLWRAPTRKEIKKRHPEWSPFLLELRYQDFQNHIKFWGPDDVELVTLDLIRSKNSKQGDLKVCDFQPDKINYRNGANLKGVIEQIKHFRWDKLGERRINFIITERIWEKMKHRIILVIDSYHHSFYSPEELNNPDLLRKISHWPNPIKPKLRYFSPRLWRYYQIVKKNRGYEPWEI